MQLKVDSYIEIITNYSVLGEFLWKPYHVLMPQQRLDMLIPWCSRNYYGLLVYIQHLLGVSTYLFASVCHYSLTYN